MAHTTSPSTASTTAANTAVGLDHVSPSLNAEDSTVYRVLKRSDLDVREVEMHGAHTVEVTVRWNRAVLHVAHVNAREGFALTSREVKKTPAAPAVAGGFVAGVGCIAVAAATGSVAAGAAGALLAIAGTGAGIALEQKNNASALSTARFVVDSAVLAQGADGEQPLVRFDAASGKARFVVPSGATGRVEYDEQPAKGFDACDAEGMFASSAVMTGARELTLEPGARYVLEAGALTVQARVVNAARPVSKRGARDHSLLRVGLGAFALAAMTVTAGFVASSDDAMVLGAETDDARLEALRGMVARSMSRAPEEVPQERTREEAPTNQQNQGAGRRSAGAEGRIGSSRAPARDARMAVQHNNDGPQGLASRPAREQVSNRGILAALGGAPMPMSGSTGLVSPFSGLLVENGSDSSSANGHFTGSDIGAADGFDGLGNVSTGQGGGGDGVGTVGQGDFGTVGRSNGRDGNGDYGQMAGNRLARRRTHGPEMHPGHIEPVAGMSAEAIRRVVLRNIGQVRHCHEQGLAQDPNIAGRVVVRFVIGGDGNVLGAAVSESNISVPTVGSCMATAVRRWSFPAPEGNGAVTVNYPFMLDAASE